MRVLTRLATCMTLIAGLTPVAAWAAPPTTLHIGLREDPDILDPTLGSSYVGRIVYSGMCDKLFDINTKLAIVPQLATSYHYTDPTHLVITLRKGVLFQDGEKFDATAAKYSLERDLTMKGSMRRGEINSVKAVEVVDPLTIRLVLKHPDAALMAQLTDRAGIMMAPAAAKKEGRNFGLHPVCAGPYSFVRRVPQDRIVLKRFHRYWNAAHYHFDRVVYRPFPNSAVRLANLQAGALDLVEYILPTDIATVRKDPKLKLAIGDSLGYQGITFNTDNGPAAKTAIGQSALVRRAFELAIDKKALIHVVYNGLFQDTAQANPPSSPYYIASIRSPARNIAAAKALLKKAGVKLPVMVTLTTPNNSDSVQTAEVIQSMVADAGFKVKLRTLEFASSLQAGYHGDFQAYLIGWSGRSDPDGNMWSFLHSGGAFNYGHYSNPEMNTLLDKARTVPDIAARRAIYTKVWQIERKDMPLIYLWSLKNIVGMKKTLVGFSQVPDGLIRLTDLHFAK